MLSGPVALNPSKVSFTFNVVYLPSVFQIISAKLLIWYIGDKENPSLVFSGDREIPTRGSTVPVGNEASPSFPLKRWTRGLGFPGSTVHQ